MLRDSYQTARSWTEQKGLTGLYSQRPRKWLYQGVCSTWTGTKPTLLIVAQLTSPAEKRSMVYDLFFSREVCTCKTDRSINLEIKEPAEEGLFVIQMGLNEETRRRDWDTALSDEQNRTREKEQRHHLHWRIFPQTLTR